MGRRSNSSYTYNIVIKTLIWVQNTVTEFRPVSLEYLRCIVTKLIWDQIGSTLFQIKKCIIIQTSPYIYRLHLHTYCQMANLFNSNKEIQESILRSCLSVLYGFMYIRQKNTSNGPVFSDVMMFGKPRSFSLLSNNKLQSIKQTILLTPIENIFIYFLINITQIQSSVTLR